MAFQDPITVPVLSAIGMNEIEAEQKPKTAAARAAKVLKQNGYTRKYCSNAWERGMRWYYKDSSVPERDLCSTSLLGIAMIDGRIEVKTN